MSGIIEHTNLLRADISGERIDRFLAKHINYLSRSKIQSLIRGGKITVNGNPVKPSYLISAGDTIKVSEEAPEPTDLSPEEINLEILYEDDSLVIVNKPAGLVVHPGAGIRSGTLVNGLLFHFNSLSAGLESFRPGLIHRLDKDTSGVIVVAKNDNTQWKLSEQFAQRKVKKIYRAFCWGEIDNNLEINHPIDRHPNNRTLFKVSDSGRPAFTYVEPLKSWGLASELKIMPRTGRTHQIRVHLSHIGHPVIGDTTYGGGSKYARSRQNLKKQINIILKQVNRQLLHAETLVFTHPETGKEISVSAPLPDDFNSLKKKLTTLFPQTEPLIN